MYDVVIAGLGNVGDEYKNSRHNLGFIMIDVIASIYNLEWNYKKKFIAQITSTTFEGKNICFVKPHTFMNNSGNSLSSLLSYYKITGDKLIVMYDDLDLECSKVRFGVGGSSGGHKGVQSIINQVSNHHLRCRFGIGRPKEKSEVVEYVLKNFSKSDLEIVNFISHQIAKNLSTMINFDLDKLHKLSKDLNKS